MFNEYNDIYSIIYNEGGSRYYRNQCRNIDYYNGYSYGDADDIDSSFYEVYYTDRDPELRPGKNY